MIILSQEVMVKEKKISGAPEIDLSGYTIDTAVLSLIPASLAERYSLMPLFKAGKTLTVAMADPKNVLALDELRTSSGMEISVVKSDEKQIKEAISEYYGISGMIEEVVKNYKPIGETKKVKTPGAEEAPIIKLLNVLITQALREKASDIHIEPEHHDVRVRLRVDGTLHEETTMPQFMTAPLVSRIKVLAGMDIAETRVPQDGRFEITESDHSIDFRVSTFPSAYGEKVVIRILDKGSMMYHLTDIGFSQENYKKFLSIIHKPHGIVLVTGPTGSGKTSTLYAALGEINSKEMNVTTVEDPIEYELPGVTQSQVNVKAGLTFASALRSILRQDPDVVLVGEIRDGETAAIAVQAALTGHMVFSTLHTNDSCGAIIRLIDMKVEPFLISSSLEGVMAQRLVRTICKKCKTDIKPTSELIQRFPELKTMAKGQGCKSCRGSGFRGRTGIFELLIIDDNIRQMINRKASADEIRKYAVESGMKTLYSDGLDKVRDGITTLDEVLRVTEFD